MITVEPVILHSVLAHIESAAASLTELGAASGQDDEQYLKNLRSRIERGEVMDVDWRSLSDRVSQVLDFSVCLDISSAPIIMQATTLCLMHF
jgi:hypothetical protein